MVHRFLLSKDDIFELEGNAIRCIEVFFLEEVQEALSSSTEWAGDELHGFRLSLLLLIVSINDLPEILEGACMRFTDDVCD